MNDYIFLFVMLLGLSTIAADCSNGDQLKDYKDVQPQPCPDTEPLSCPDITEPASTKFTLTENWKEDACGTFDLKINQYDSERGWVYLAFRQEPHQEPFYSDKLPFRGRKTDRAALFLGHKEFVGITECADQSCTVRCQTLYGSRGE